MAITTEYVVPVTGRTIYSGLSTDTKPVTAVASSEFFETDTKELYSYDGANWLLLRSYGSVHVADVGRAQQPHNRFINGVSDTQAELGHMTWEDDERVYSVRFKLVADSGTTASGEVVRVVFDAAPVDDTTEDGQAWTWLQAAPSDQDTDVEYFELNYIAAADLTGANDGWSEWFQFSSPLRRADFLFVDGNSGADELGIFAEVA